MRLSEIQNILPDLEKLNFVLPNGEIVPSHFHVTEVGQINKKFIDCGGVVRDEKVIQFQLWNADDYDHRLQPKKLNNIINLSKRKLDLEDLEVEVEYQGDTIETYTLAFENNQFLLVKKFTTCLAQDACGVEVKPEPATQCAPNSGCC